MSVVEEIRIVIQDFLAPELPELKERVASLEKRMEEKFDHADNRFRQVGDRFRQVDDCFNQAEKTPRPAQTRHDQVTFAIQQLADYTTLAPRVSRRELITPTQ